MKFVYTTSFDIAARFSYLDTAVLRETYSRRFDFDSGRLDFSSRSSGSYSRRGEEKDRDRERERTLSSVLPITTSHPIRLA